jgi:hypothetical protein
MFIDDYDAPGVGDMLARIEGSGRTTPNSYGGGGVEGIATRPAPEAPNALYDNVDHPTLKAMVTEQVDPEQVGQIGQTWVESGTRMTQFADEVAGAVNNSRTEWQGEAGDAARRFISDLGSWVGQAGQGAQLAGGHATQHAEALAAARNAMPEPVEFDVDKANAELRQITDPVQLLNRYAEHMETYAAQQAAQRRAAEVVTAYDTALSEASAMPAFAPPPAMAGGDPVPPAPRTEAGHETPMAHGGRTDHPVIGG